MTDNRQNAAGVDAELLRLNRRLIEELPDPVLVVDRDYRVRYVNPAGADIFGVTGDDIAGHALKEFTGDGMFDTTLKPKLDRCFAGEDIRQEDMFPFPARDPLIMDARYLPLTGGDGSIDSAVIILRDIGPKGEMPLSASCRDKIVELLAIARKVNHDINNPLFAITGYLELLLQVETDERKIEYLDSALKSAQRIAEMSRSLSNAILSMEPMHNELKN